MHTRLPNSSWSLGALALIVMLAALVRTGTAQTFSKVTNPANAIVANGAAPPGSFVGASWIDSDGDGDLDLFISEVGLFRNDGGGAFAWLPAALPNMGFAIGNTWADMDNDGDLDCFLSGGSPNGSALYRNDGANVFTKLTDGVLGDTLGNGAWGCAWGDADRDGRVDLVTAAAYGFNGGDNPNRFLHNLGGGVFARIDSLDFVQTLGPFTIPTWSDFDLDGDLDLFISAGPATGVRGLDWLYRNRGEASPLWFQRITDAPLGTDLHDGQVYNWIDYDNDGDLDLYLTNFGGPTPLANDLYRNDGGGVFVRLTGVQAGPIVTDAQLSLASIWQDFDNDGDLDCYVTNAGLQPAKFYRNEGGTFTSLTFAGLTDPGPHWGASAGDDDGDGDMDLFVAGRAGTYGLYENTTSNGNAWLDVTLTGTVSNRAAIGARVRMRAIIGGQPRWQLREVSAQNSFGGMNSLVQHFGLGDATAADSVIVEWPSGIRTVRVAIPVRTRLAVIEDTATATEASLRSVDVEDGRVNLTWWAPASVGASATIERREGTEDWKAIGGGTVDGAGALSFSDVAIEPGHRYGYRLALAGANGVTRVGETWVEVPERLAFALRSVAPNPSHGRIAIAFDLSSGAPATLEVFDVNGRRMEGRSVGALGAGRHVLALDDRRLAAGVYVVRLRQSGRTAKLRATVLD